MSERYANLRYKQYLVLPPAERNAIDGLLDYVEDYDYIIFKKDKIRCRYYQLDQMPLRLFLYLVTKDNNGVIPLSSPILCLPRLFKIGQKELLNCYYFNILGVMKWLKEMIEMMKDVEAKTFHSDILPSNDSVSVESMGYYNLIYSLSEGDITREYAVQNKSWNSVMQWFKKKRLDAENEYRAINKQ